MLVMPVLRVKKSSRLPTAATLHGAAHTSPTSHADPAAPTRGGVRVGHLGLLQRRLPFGTARQQQRSQQPQRPYGSVLRINVVLHLSLFASLPFCIDAVSLLVELNEASNLLIDYLETSQPFGSDFNTTRQIQVIDPASSDD